jgi:hypothetical protein
MPTSFGGMFEDMDYTTTKAGAEVLHIGIMFETYGFSVCDAFRDFLDGSGNMVGSG